MYIPNHNRKVFKWELSKWARKTMKSMKALALTIIAASLFALQTKAQTIDNVNVKTTNNSTEMTTGQIQQAYVNDFNSGQALQVNFNGDQNQGSGYWTATYSDNLNSVNPQIWGNILGSLQSIPDSIEGQPVEINYMLSSDLNGHHGVMGKINMKINEYDIEGLINYVDTATGSPKSVSFKIPDHLYKEWLDHDTTAVTPFSAVESYTTSSNPLKLDSIFNNINVTMSDPYFDGYKENLAQMNETNPFSAQGDSITMTLEEITNGGTGSVWGPNSITIDMNNYGTKSSAPVNPESGDGPKPDDLDAKVYKSTNGAFTVTQLSPDSVTTHPGAVWANTYKYTFSDLNKVPFVQASANGLPIQISTTQEDDSTYYVTVGVETPDSATGSYDMQVTLGDSTIVGVDEPDVTVPEGFDMGTYPNPSMTNTNLRYSLNATEDVGIQIFDAMGRLVDNFEVKNQGPGTHELYINTEFFSPGAYFFNLTTKQGSESTIFLKQ